MVPVTPPLKPIGVIVAPEQIVWFAGVANTMVCGLTTTVAVAGVPGQTAEEVMVNVTVTGVVPVLVNAPVILPVPLAAIPVTDAVLSRVQLYVMPVAPPLKTIGVIVAPVQIVWDLGVDTTLVGRLITTVAVTGMPAQPFAVGVIVNVTVVAAVPVLDKIPLISPVPLAAIPLTAAVLLRVQL